MKPVTVSTTIERPREEVFAFLDVLGNHERFTDHFMTDWTLEGPAAGVGARARMRVRAPGPEDWIDMTVIEGEAPVRTAERSLGKGGKRVTRGTYTLEDLGGGRTGVQFEVAYEQVPLAERITAPFGRLWLKRQNARAMERLKALLESQPAGERAAAAEPPAAGAP